MNDRMRSDPWDLSVGVIRVGDLVLTRTESSARLSRDWSDRHAASYASSQEDAELPGKQAGLLAFLMRYPGQIVSKSRLIEAVWGQGGVAPAVLDVHMTRLRRVLQRVDASGQSVRIETRRGMGYALHVDQAE